MVNWETMISSVRRSARGVVEETSDVTRREGLSFGPMLRAWAVMRQGVKGIEIASLLPLRSLRLVSLLTGRMPGYLNCPPA